MEERKGRAEVSEQPCLQRFIPAATPTQPLLIRTLFLFPLRGGRAPVSGEGNRPVFKEQREGRDLFLRLLILNRLRLRTVTYGQAAIFRGGGTSSAPSRRTAR